MKSHKDFTESDMKHPVRIGQITLREEGPFFLIAGPCVIESEDITVQVADFLKALGDDMDIPILFKTSYDKANRTAIDSFRGPGIDKGLEIIDRIKERTGLPVLSDVHLPAEAEKAGKILDVIQIPAFLCRQTDLLTTAARTGRPINIKKGQFLSPWEVEQAVNKVTNAGNSQVILTERGSFFGYNNLVVDMRSIPAMKTLGFPVVFDATHSVQLPGGAGNRSGGQREYVEPLARAAVAAGANGVFMEVHPDPDKALCDGPNALPLQQLRPLAARLKQIHSLVRNKNEK